MIGPPTLTIVVVNYNTRELLLGCLSSIERSCSQSAARIETILVDNGSTDGSVEAATEAFPRVTVHPCRVNRGFGAGANLVLRGLIGPYALVLNADMEALGDAPAAMVRFAERTPRAGIVGGSLVYPDGRFQHGAFRFPTPLMDLFDLFPPHPLIADSWLNGRYSRAFLRRPRRVDHPLGGAMLIRREVVEQTGGFDEAYFMYCEELDLARRASHLGWEAWHTPEGRFVHHAGAATRQTPDAMAIALRRSRKRYAANHRSALSRGLSTGIDVAGQVRDTLALIRDLRSGSISARQFEERRSWYRRRSRG